MKWKFAYLNLVIAALLFTVEKVTSHLSWAIIVNGVKSKGSGSFPTYPPEVSLTDNGFITLFLVLGGIPFLWEAYKKLNTKLEELEDKAGRERRETKA